MKGFALKHAWSQTSQSARDAAIQRRILATGRLHDALAEHNVKGRKFFVGLTATQQRKLAGKLAAKLGMIEPVDSRARLLVHLGQIHGDLSRQVAGHVFTSSSTTGLYPPISGAPAQGQPPECGKGADTYQRVEG
jgi:catalase